MLLEMSIVTMGVIEDSRDNLPDIIDEAKRTGRSDAVPYVQKVLAVVSRVAAQTEADHGAILDEINLRHRMAVN
jgi:hypothetical protein